MFRVNRMNLNCLTSVLVSLFSYSFSNAQIDPVTIRGEKGCPQMDLVSI